MKDSIFSINKYQLFIENHNAKMKFLPSKNTRATKRQLKSYKRCVERMKPFLRLFKLCGMFANEITEGRLKRCSLPFYCTCVLWVSFYVSYMCYLLYHFVQIDSVQLRITVDFVKHLIGYISLSVNVVSAYSSQNHFIQVRKMTKRNDIHTVEIDLRWAHFCDLYLLKDSIPFSSSTFSFLVNVTTCIPRELCSFDITTIYTHFHVLNLHNCSP